MTSIIKCGMELFIHSEISTMQLLKFCNEYVTSYTLRYDESMLGLNLIRVSRMSPWEQISVQIKSKYNNFHTGE